MFGKLKDKLKDWAKKFSQEQPEEEVIEEPKKKESKEKVKKADKKPAKKTKEKKITVPASQDENIDSKEEELILEKEFEDKKVEALDSSQEVQEPEQKKKSILSFFKRQKTKETVQEVPASQDEVVDTPEVKEELKEEIEEKGIFSKILSKVQKTKITQENFDVYAEELEMLLLENNVAMEVAEKIVKDLREKLVGKEILKKEVESEIYENLKDIIYDILIDPFLIRDKIKGKLVSSQEPYVILFCGINGTGKTTTIAKIASSLNDDKISCIMAAADTFRSAAVEQIKTHGERLGIKVISSDYGSDPASVGYDAIQYAKKHGIKTVLIDTAGRMHTDKNLLKEIEKISRICNPDLKIFVGESITGNDAIEQIRAFNASIGIDGIVLTKADIDEKGGTALSVGYITKKPILYLGTGQEYSKIEPFSKEKFIKSLGLD